MKASDLTPDELIAAVQESASAAGAHRCPVTVMVNDQPTDAKVVRVTANGLGLTLWAES